MEITVAEMYSGIGGVRLGLEKGNNRGLLQGKENENIRRNISNIEGRSSRLESFGQVSVNPEPWSRSKEGQSGELFERRRIEERGSSGGRECVDSQQRLRDEEGQCESFIEGSDGRQFKKFRCVWANDWKHAGCIWNEEKKRWQGSKNQSEIIYTKHWNDGTYIDQDIRTVDPDSIPDFELLTAGFPCQSFSLAGKRKGFEDTRGTLFYEIARIASAKRPKLLLLENVKGLLSNDEGRTFAKILQTLDELGYLVEWQVLNSKHFGVPQNRERVFIIGHSRADPTRQIFPIGQANSLASKKASREQQQVSTCIDSNYWKGADKHGQRTVVLQEHSFSGEDGRGRGFRTYDDEVPALTQQMGTGGNNVPMVVADRTRSYANLGRNLESPKPITNALSGVQKDNLVLAVETAYTKANMKEGRFSKECHGLDGGRSKAVMIANAVDCDGYLRSGARPRDGNGKPQLLPIGYRRIRRLTPVECERLQGFPDRWTEGVSDTQRYKLLGNAVTTNVIAFLGEKLKGCIE